MPDIAMCTEKKCERREKCYRYTAMPDEYWQSYFTNIDPNGCEYFIDNKVYGDIHNEDD